MTTIKKSTALTILAKTSPNDSKTQNISNKKKAPKLFIGGLDPSTTLQTLENYFSQFGKLDDCVIKIHKSSAGRRNFGFVTYRESHTAHFVSTLKHVIDQKRVDCRKAKVKDSPVDNFAKDPEFKTSKLFIGGLPKDLTVEEMKEYFSRFGQVIDCVIIPNKETKRSRCFGFVQFTTCKAVEDVIANYYRIKLKGRWVECKKAIPKEACLELERNKEKYKKLSGWRQPPPPPLSRKLEVEDKENNPNNGNIKIQNIATPVRKEVKRSPGYVTPAPSHLMGQNIEVKRDDDIQVKIENLSSLVLSNYPRSEITMDDHHLDRVSKEIANTLLGNPIVRQGGKGVKTLTTTSDYKRKRDFCPY